MTFEVPAEAYDAFMGRYSRHLASQMADLAGVAAGQTVLDVGCGPGALATELAARVGPEAVTAVDPSEHFVLALRSRIPGVNVQRASGENLPLPDDGFDASFAQLVVHFMDDPVAGLREMGRVTKAGGSVAACVWDHAAGGRGPLSVYYQALHEVDPSRPDESGRPGTRRGHLAELFRDAGFADLDEATFTVRVEHESFEEWWAPYELGVGTISGVLDELGPERVAQLRDRCRELLPEAPFTLEARAWAVRAAAA